MYQDIMFSAILKNRIEFVNLLLENGFNLKNFLTYERYLQLFEKVIKMIKKMRKIKIFLKGIRGKFVDEFIP